jgi:F0F1-type ATP synthase membrane subunit b/b'
MNKRLIRNVTVVYALGIVIGLVLFHSPNFSKSYLQQYGADHERYRAIIKTPEFKAYEERPALHPVHGKLEEDVEFVEAYLERPEYLREENRVWWFVEYFKVLNSTVFILYLAGFVGRPLLDYLDGQIKDIRKGLDDAARARQDAKASKAGVQEKVAGWAEMEDRINKESEATIAQHVAKIQAEESDAATLLARQTAERKQAELFTAARTIKTELVTEAIQRLEERYKNELTLEKLSVNVDHFVNMMERLS